MNKVHPFLLYTCQGQVFIKGMLERRVMATSH